MGSGSASVDPIVVALAVALTTRRPVATLVEGSGGAKVSAPSAPAVSSTARPRDTAARQPRSKNRKG